ncbi:MAG: hypothetical protein AAGG45_08480 [Pseudomonadota bacterium]
MIKTSLAAFTALTLLPQLASALGCCQLKDWKGRSYCIAAASQTMCEEDERFTSRKAIWINNSGCIRGKCRAGKATPIAPYDPYLSSAIENPHDFQGEIDIRNGAILDLGEEAFAMLAKTGMMETERGLMLTERGALVTLTKEDIASVEKYGALLVSDSFVVSSVEGGYALIELEDCPAPER